MSFIKRISKVYEKAKVIEFNNSSKFIIMSDCHRGDGNLGDNFSKNQDIYFYALNYYYKNCYTYIELGDGDELWENKKISEIMEEHSHVFWILSEFYKKNRLYFIYGNHDMVKKDEGYIRRNFCDFFDEQKGEYILLFRNIKFYEVLVLREETSHNKILLIHGHQGDFFNDQLWKVSRFLVRYVWRILENYGVNDPTSTAKNYKKKKVIEKKFTQWIKEKKVMVIAGHTHRPMFPEVGEIPYFNDGSCVHPRCITAIEISNGKIQLVKWCVSAREDGVLAIKRSILAGPRKINDYFKIFE